MNQEPKHRDDTDERRAHAIGQLVDKAAASLIPSAG
jgi:hypothetical protein